MPVFVAELLGGLVSLAASMAGRVLLSLGISVVCFTGLNSLFTGMESLIETELTGLPASFITVLSLMNIDKFVSLIFSAFATKLTLRGLSAGGALYKLAGV